MQLPPLTDWASVLSSLDGSVVDLTVTAPDTFKPGRTAGMAAFRDFVDNRLKNYADNRNDPNVDVQSGLSPWIR